MLSLETPQDRSQISYDESDAEAVVGGRGAGPKVSRLRGSTGQGQCPCPSLKPEKSTSQCGVVDIGFDIAAQSVTLMLIAFRFTPTDAAPIM